jgi:hypothetical protein
MESPWQIHSSYSLIGSQQHFTLLRVRPVTQWFDQVNVLMLKSMVRCRWRKLWEWLRAM